MTACHICGKRLPKNLTKDKNYWKVKGYYHFTGKYRDAAHTVCKLRFDVPE